MDDNLYLAEQDFDADTDEAMEAAFALDNGNDDPQMIAQRDLVGPPRPPHDRLPYDQRPPYDRFDRYDRNRFDRFDRFDRYYDRFDRGFYGRGGFPTTPPPGYIPRRPFPHPGPFPIRECLYGFDYLWLRDGRSFWARLTNVTRGMVDGYRWDGFRWRPFRVSVRDIDNYVCM